MYTTSKKRNVIPKTGIQQQKIITNQADSLNRNDLSKNDLRIQYHSQNKTTSKTRSAHIHPAPRLHSTGI